jgi:hypothetical protein
MKQKRPGIFKLFVRLLFIAFLCVLGGQFIRFVLLPFIDGQIANVMTKTTVVTPKTKEACLEEGGEWRRPGPWPKETCMVPYIDGGKTCIAGLQCEAKDCLFSSGPRNIAIFAVGKCPKYQIYFGCIQEVHFGVTSNAICLD